MQVAGSSAARAVSVGPRQSRLSRAYLAYVSQEWQAHVVIVTALLAMAYVQAILPLYWGAGDPMDHYRLARLFLHKPDGLFIPWRPPGMALFLILTGVAWLDTFKVLVVLYAAMSAAIPVLIYVILRKYSSTWGMVAALIAIVGAVPFAYSRTVEPEQLFYFLHFVVLALIAAYFARPESPRLPYAIALAMFALNLVRPVAALYYWIFVGCAVVLVRRPLRHVALATAVYVGLMGGWALADRYWGASLFPTVYMPETAAQRVFGEVYYSGGSYQFVPERPPAPAITIGDGPASRQMYDGLRWVVQAAPDLWEQPNAERPYLLFARYAGHPETFVRAVASRPNFAYFDFLRHALQARYGGAGAERVMYGVAVEHGNTGARGIAGYFLHNPVKLLVGGLPPFGGRNLLGGLYFVQLKKTLGHIYSLTISEPDIISPANGPASTEFFRAVDFFARAYPDYWQHTNSFLSRFKRDPHGLLKAIFNQHNPQGMYEGFWWDSFNKYYGVGPADRLFYRVAVETIRVYPHALVLFWDNALHIALIRPLGAVSERHTSAAEFWGSVLTNHGALAEEVRQNDPTGLAPGLARELRGTVHYDKRISLAYGTMHLWAPFFVIATLALFAFCLVGPASYLAAFLGAAFAYQVAVDAVFGNLSAARYEDVFVLLPVILACLGVHFAVSTLGHPDRYGLAGPRVSRRRARE